MRFMPKTTVLCFITYKNILQSVKDCLTLQRKGKESVVLAGPLHLCFTLKWLRKMTKRKGQMVREQKPDLRFNGEEALNHAAKRFKHEYVLYDGMHTCVETDLSAEETLDKYRRALGKPNLTLNVIR
jgi:hypothetical protein